MFKKFHEFVCSLNGVILFFLAIFFLNFASEAIIGFCYFAVRYPNRTSNLADLGAYTFTPSYILPESELNAYRGRQNYRTKYSVMYSTGYLDDNLTVYHWKRKAASKSDAEEMMAAGDVERRVLYDYVSWTDDYYFIDPCETIDDFIAQEAKGEALRLIASGPYTIVCIIIFIIRIQHYLQKTSQ